MNGSLFLGEPDERDAALDLQFKAFLGDLFETEGYEIDQLIAGCRRAQRYLEGIKRGS